MCSREHNYDYQCSPDRLSFIASYGSCDGRTVYLVIHTKLQSSQNGYSTESEIYRINDIGNDWFNRLAWGSYSYSRRAVEYQGLSAVRLVKVSVTMREY